MFLPRRLNRRERSAAPGGLGTSLSAAALLLAGCGAGAPPAPAPGADVVLVIIDTLRADGLSCYGNPRPTTPHLDALAARGTLFEECLAQAPNTATSHASLFTGLPPWTHRVANLTDAETGTAGLPPAFVTLAERFSAAGYQTAAFTDGGPLGTAWNLMQGFETKVGRYEGARAKVDQALAFLESQRDGRPLFLLLHTYQVHQPFAPPREYVERFDPDYTGVLTERVAEVLRGRAAGEEFEPNGKLLMRGKAEFTERDFEHLRALYDAEIAYTDAELERLWARLAAGGDLERTVVAVTSDHGEEFGEHGHWGHRQLHRETLRVPLILLVPGGGDTRRRVEERVSLIDLGPTLLAAVGIPDGAEGFEAAGGGRSLLPVLEGSAPDRTSFAATTEHLYLDDARYPRRRSVRDGARALLVEQRGGPEQTSLFELGDDRGEQHPIHAGDPGFAGGADLARALARQLREAEALRVKLLRGQATQVLLRPDAAELRELRRLGYLGDED